MRWVNAAVATSALLVACNAPAPDVPASSVQLVWRQAAQPIVKAALLGPQARAIETHGVEGVFVPGCLWTSADGTKSIRLGSLAEEGIANRLYTAKKQFGDLPVFYTKYARAVALSGLGSRASRIGFFEGSEYGAFTIETAERVFEIEVHNLNAAAAEAFVRALSLEAAAP